MQLLEAQPLLPPLAPTPHAFWICMEPRKGHPPISKGQCFASRTSNVLKWLSPVRQNWFWEPPPGLEMLVSPQSHQQLRLMGKGPQLTVIHPSLLYYSSQRVVLPPFLPSFLLFKGHLPTLSLSLLPHSWGLGFPPLIPLSQQSIRDLSQE